MTFRSFLSFMMILHDDNDLIPWSYFTTNMIIFRSFLFFFMLINLALSSICAGVQTFVAFILDEKPEWTKWEKSSWLSSKSVLAQSISSSSWSYMWWRSSAVNLSSWETRIFIVVCAILLALWIFVDHNLKSTFQDIDCGLLWALVSSTSCLVFQCAVVGASICLRWAKLWWRGGGTDNEKAKLWDLCSLLNLKDEWDEYDVGVNWLLSGFWQQMQLLTSSPLFDRGASFSSFFGASLISVHSIHIIHMIHMIITFWGCYWWLSSASSKCDFHIYAGDAYCIEYMIIDQWSSSSYVSEKEETS